MKSYQKIFFILFSLSLCSATAPKSRSYIYIDGSNNEYRIKPDSLIYSPITPEESSSGEYSGGAPKQVRINSEQFSRIELIIKSILKDKNKLIDTRLMGCGTLLVGTKTVYIDSDSKLKADLETELNSCLK